MNPEADSSEGNHAVTPRAIKVFIDEIGSGTPPVEAAVSVGLTLVEFERLAERDQQFREDWRQARAGWELGCWDILGWVELMGSTAASARVCDEDPAKVRRRIRSDLRYRLKVWRAQLRFVARTTRTLLRQAVCFSPEIGKTILVTFHPHGIADSMERKRRLRQLRP